MLSTDFATAIKLKAAIIAGGYKGTVYDYTTYIPGLLESSKDTAAALEGGYSNTQFPVSEKASRRPSRLPTIWLPSASRRS
jgi:hypothetical protein